MINKIKSLFINDEKHASYYSVDLHSHLIPGIDDGVKTMAESVECIKKLQSLGFKKLIITPHIMHGRYNNTSEVILKGLEEVKSELLAQNIDIQLQASSEYYLNEHFMELLEKKDILTFGKNYLLFEMSYALKPPYLESAIHEMKVAGYTPVLAHPERYLFMHKDMKMYESLKDMGVLFQVNMNSFGGYYSAPVKKVALKLLDAGYIDFLGSDTHKMSHLEHFSKNLQSKVVKKIFSKNKILNDELF